MRWMGPHRYHHHYTTLIMITIIIVIIINIVSIAILIIAIPGTSNRFANYVDMHFLKKGDKAGSFHFLLGRLVMMMMMMIMMIRMIRMIMILC